MTVTSGGEIDWLGIGALLTAGAAAFFTGLLWWVARTELAHVLEAVRSTEREARLSRRPVLELSIVRAIDETWIWHVEPERLAITIEVRVENVGEGPAKDIEVTARDGLPMFALEGEIARTREWIAADVRLRGQIPYIPAHDHRLVALQDFVDLDAHVGRPGGSERAVGFAVDATFADSYDDRRPVFAPIRQVMTYTGLPGGPE